MQAWRNALSIVLVLAAPVFTVARAAEQSVPSKPVRLIVTTSAGSGVDIFGRTVAQALTEPYKQQVIVENRPGAGRLIGAGTIAAATPAGYTLGIASVAHVVAADTTPKRYAARLKSGYSAYRKLIAELALTPQ